MNSIEYEEIMDNISLGVELASLRKKMGLTQDDIASKIHVCSKIVTDIENGQLADTPVVFMKGYIRSYAEIVGLPSDDYQPCLDNLSEQHKTYQMKNYSQHNKNRRRTLWLLFFSVLIFVTAIGVTAYCVWNDNQHNFIEVSHYITPIPNDPISNS